jgi:hypothetical protein
MEVIIYALVDPRTGRRRYVGKTSNLEARMKSHCAARSRLPAVRAWIQELRELHLSPVARVLARVSVDGADKLEAEWIARSRRANEPLLNASTRGGGRPALAMERRASRRVIARLYAAEVAQLEAVCRALGIGETEVMRRALAAFAEAVLEKSSSVSDLLSAPT